MKEFKYTIDGKEILFDWGYATIDADINFLKSDGLYHMLIKKEVIPSAITLPPYRYLFLSALPLRKISRWLPAFSENQSALGCLLPQ